MSQRGIKAVKFLTLTELTVVYIVPLATFTNESLNERVLWCPFGLSLQHDSEPYDGQSLSITTISSNATFNVSDPDFDTRHYGNVTYKLTPYQGVLTYDIQLSVITGAVGLPCWVIVLLLLVLRGDLGIRAGGALAACLPFIAKAHWPRRRAKQPERQRGNHQNNSLPVTTTTRPQLPDYLAADPAPQPMPTTLSPVSLHILQWLYTLTSLLTFGLALSAYLENFFPSGYLDNGYPASDAVSDTKAHVSLTRWVCFLESEIFIADREVASKQPGPSFGNKQYTVFSPVNDRDREYVLAHDVKMACQAATVMTVANILLMNLANLTMNDYISPISKALFTLTIVDQDESAPADETDTPKPRTNPYALIRHTELSAKDPQLQLKGKGKEKCNEDSAEPSSSPLGPGRFRLLKFRLDGDKLSCTTSSKDLNEAPAYIALSYSGGFVDVSHSIEVDGKDFLVLRKQFVFEVCDGNVWIDAVAINQKDIVGKTQQVQLMSAIYQKATFVVGWLGELTEGNRRGLQLIKRVMETIGIREIYDASMNNMRSRPSVAETFTIAEQHNLPYIGHPAWEDVVTIYQKGWFGRVWVIQEFLFAKKFTFLCGDVMIEDDLVHFAASLGQLPFLEQAVSEARGSSLGLHFARSLATWREDWGKGVRQNMFSCLLKTLFAAATDSRDKVFALVSLCNDIGPEIIDYKQSAENVMLAFALHHFRAHAPNIEAFLSLPQTFNPIEGKPSWVTAWIGGKPSGSFALGLGKHSGLNQSIIPSSRTKMGIAVTAGRYAFFVDSSKFDTIAVIVDPQLPVNDIPSIEGMTRGFHNDEYAAWFKKWWTHELKRLEFNCELADLTEGLGTYPTGEEIEDVPGDGATCSAAKLKWDAARILSLGTQIHDDYNQSGMTLEMLRVGEEYERKLRDYQLCMATVQNDISVGGIPPSRLYAITENGYVAWVPPETAIGDELHMIHGARVPYILRRLEEHESAHAVSLVGDAYVHGLMMGTRIYESGLLEPRTTIDIL
ncbi:uncharacterized protein AB675_10434 [Cyphellophora attinorum]|uniref:Heterokaryon incompatibility domain-containing protein n=1 Tax=Cyphellophora attinorum TaxID=1664694 RepID=A0A0N1GYP4_9EURO|nr:uncharacterized protein AB675_10434 [Phialophora attinorum]KPI35950.1 hypothetical protein AB675_10434 [Phialophora attinorum]